VPSGSNVAIDYEINPPVLAVKLQEMFGATESPKIINGKVNLIVHLLSPARRPLQITTDLIGFWNSSYKQVQKEMKGRYPKHPWPDDPFVATPTKKVKPNVN
jgi:ATP-dependent helicase HrpB